jgi:Tfp pilus assembly protein PilO
MKQTHGNKFSPWRIYVGGAVVCAALSIAAYCVGVRPATLRRAEQVEKQSELHAARQKANNLAGQLNTARAELTRVNDAIASLPLRLEPVAQINQRLARLTDMADSIRPVKLTIEEMRPGVASEGRDYKTLPIYIAGSGTYPACAAFLHGLRKNFPDMAVLSFDTTNNSASPDSPAATFQFELAWHAAKN